jgi:nucleolin
MAFVTMASEEQRDTAMEKLNEIELDGRIMYVDKAKPRSESKQPGKAKDRVQETNNTKMYVGNISYETTKESLQTFFGEYGTVLDVYIPVDKATEAPRGFAFVTMEKEGASKAIESASGVELDGRVIEVKESLPRGQKAPPRQNNRSSNEMKIYVGNLSFDTEEDTLRALFEEFGELIDLYIPTDRYSGRPRGFAFVTMEKDNASRAIEAIDGLEVDERIIRVNEAQPKGYQASFSNDWEEEGEWGEE